MHSVLVIDDEQLFRERLARSLRKKGFCVHEAQDGRSAMDAVAQSAPGSILLDLRLATETGLDLLPRLRKLAPEARIIILTGYGNISNAVTATKMGADEFLSKPASVSDIEQAILGNQSPQTITEQMEPPTLARVEWEYMQRILEDCQGNISEAARKLGIHRRSLQRKLMKYPPKN